MSVDAGPFALGPVGAGGPAVLCLHGLSGTPYEVRSCAEALAARGFACLGPRLPGHGESPEALAQTRHEEWLDAAQAAVDELESAHDRVYALGLSMGGVLTLELCARRELSGAVVLAAPVDLGRLARWLVPPLSRVMRFLPSRSDIRDPEALAVHPSYPRMPLASVRELIELGRKVGAVLEKIDAPLQLVFSRGDRVVPLENAELIRERVSSEVCRLELLEASGHVMPVDVEKARVAEVAVSFLAELEANG